MKQELGQEVNAGQEREGLLRAGHIVEDEVKLDDRGYVQYTPIQDTINIASIASSDATIHEGEILWDNELRLSDAEREWPTNTGPELNRLHLPPQSLWAGPVARRKAVSRGWSKKKIRTMDLSMAKLVVKLLLHGHTDGVPITTNTDSVSSALGPYAARHTDQLKAAVEEIETRLEAIKLEVPWAEGRFQSAHIAYPYYRQDDEYQYHSICEGMNKAIITLFQENAAGRLNFKSLMLKIGHNLLISSAPPNLDTYNILLTEFAKRREATLVDDVFVSFRETHMRPNEMTCATLLEHYTDRNDFASFNKLVRLMRCDGDSLMTAQPNVRISSAGANRLRRLRNGKITQAVHPTPMVYDALMHGLLKFAGFRAALEVCAELNIDGWGLSAVGLEYFLRDCTVKRDWNSGIAVWAKLKQMHAKSKQRRRREGVQERLKIDTYLKMLRLCQVCQKEAEFKEVFNEAVEVGYSARYISSQVRVDASEVDSSVEDKGFADVTSLSARKTEDSTTSPNPAQHSPNLLDLSSGPGTRVSHERSTSAAQASQTSREDGVSREDGSAVKADNTAQATTALLRSAQHQQTRPFNFPSELFDISPGPVQLSHSCSMSTAKKAKEEADEGHLFTAQAERPLGREKSSTVGATGEAERRPRRFTVKSVLSKVRHRQTVAVQPAI